MNFCKYFDRCGNLENYTCAEAGGMFYSWDRPGGCYREQEYPPVSVVLPVNNDAPMLHKTLRSIYEIEPEEILFGLDRCIDPCEKLIRKEAQNHPETETRIRHFASEEGRGWAFRPAYLRRCLYQDAENDIILNTSADLWLDPTIRERLNMVGHPYGLISFNFYDKPWTIQSLEKPILNLLHPGFSGLLAFSRKAWLETEDQMDLMNLSKGEDTHLQWAIKKKYPVKHIHSRSLHLRPRESKEDHYNRGKAQHEILHYGALKALIHNIVTLRPAAFVGHRHASHLGCGHVAVKAGELNGVTLCDSCAGKMAEEYAYRMVKQ